HSAVSPRRQRVEIQLALAIISRSQSRRRIALCLISMKRDVVRTALLFLVSSVPLAAQSPPPTAMPGLPLSIDQLKAQYTHLGVGRRLKPKQWPHGARVAVALSFDID